MLVEVTLSRRERDLTGQDGGILLVEVTDRAGERDLMGQDGGIVVVEVTVLDRGVRRESTMSARREVYRHVERRTVEVTGGGVARIGQRRLVPHPRAPRARRAEVEYR